jgi:outer membrane receptor for ferrienterochelin and colicins
VVVTRSASADDAEVDQYLSMDLEDLMDLEVVSATHQPLSLQEVPATVRVITAQQIRENGWLTLEDALSGLPGVQFRNTLSLNSYAFVRGIPNQNNLVLVLVDGIPVNELNSGGFYGGGQYNLANVERIEVVFGPASARYGTNAISGVIDIVTRKPEEDSGLELVAGGGGFATAHATISHRHFDEERQLGVAASAMAKTSEKAWLGGAAGDGNWSDDMENFEDDYALDGRLRWRELLLAATWQNRQSSASTWYPSEGTEYHDHDSFWNIRFLNLWAEHRWDAGDLARLDSRAWYRDTTVLGDSVLKVTDTGQVGYYRPNRSVGADATLTGQVADTLHLAGGLAFESEHLAQGFATASSDSPEQRPPRPAPPEMTHGELVSAFAELDYQPLESMRLTAGARFDHSTVYAQRLNPRAGLVFTPGSSMFKLLYAEAFRAPRPWDYSDGLGNDVLEPEKMRTLEASAGTLVADLFRVDVAAYRNHLHGVLTKEFEGDDWRWVNLGEVTVLGLEPTASLQWRWLGLWGNYTLQHVTDDGGVPLDEIAMHGAHAGVRVAFTDRLVLNLQGDWLGARSNPQDIPSTGDDRIDPALLLGGSLSFLDLDGVDLQLIVRNALDTEYYHPSNLDVTRYRQPQRTVLVQLAWRP